MALPQIIIGFDVETTDWDAQTSFARHDEHLEMGFPCQADLNLHAGHVCGFGYAVFHRTHKDSNTYIGDEPVCSVV